MEKPELVEITRIRDEADGIKTIFFRNSMESKPGQFVMIWIPRMDEKPFAISYSENGEIGITVSGVGPFSNKLTSMNVGDKLGIRGPYGNGYTIDKDAKSIVMVGGGYGSASLTLLSEEAVKKGCSVKFILGARNFNKLVFVERIKKLLGEENLIITTDDGSTGIKGFVTDALQDLLSKEHVDKIFVCGPDKMMKAVVDIGIERSINGEVSMERYMKCGFGICGHCCVDPIGIRLCVEGPVVNFETAAKVTELGNYHRVKSSMKVKL
jgi:dihydroorotate dehydrogenase electron transfer subunit